MKRRACLLTIVALLAGLLAACAQPTAESVEVTRVVTEVVTEREEVEVTKQVEVQVEVTSTPEPTPTPKPKPTGKITVWGWTAALRDTLEAAGVVEAFNEEYPDVEVEMVYYAPADVYTNLPLALTAGESDPDVCLVENSHVAEFVHMGGLLDVTDRLQPYVDNLVDYKLVDCEKDGSYYCFPWDGGPVVMYYRRDVFDAAGLPSAPNEVTESIATWDDYLEACQTIKEESGAFCFAHNRAQNYARLYEMVLWQQGLGYYDLETGEVTVDSPENIATLEMFGQFWDEELVSDSLEWTDPWYAELGAPYEGPDTPPEEQPIATLVEASWMDVFLKSWIAPGTAGNWGVARMPAFEAGQVRASNDGGSSFVIPKESDNPEAAWAFVEFALGREESLNKMFALSGFIPSLTTAYDDPIYLATDSFFGGQNTYGVYADVNAEIPEAGVYGPDYSMMNGSVSVAIQRYATGEATAEEALQEAAAEIRANLQ